MTLNAYYVGVFKTASGRTLYTARIYCPLLDCEDVFDSQEDAEAFIARETARLAPYGIALRKVNAPTEMTIIQQAYVQYGAELFRKEERGCLYVSERRWTYVIAYNADAEKISEMCRRIAALNEKYGFKWESCQCGSETQTCIFCNRWEEQQIDAVLN